LEAENATLTTTNMTLPDQATTLGGDALAGGAAGCGAGATAPVIFMTTPALVDHQDLINYTMKVVRMIYD
jgi:hypothetical protein